MYASNAGVMEDATAKVDMGALMALEGEGKETSSECKVLQGMQGYCGHGVLLP